MFVVFHIFFFYQYNVLQLGSIDCLSLHCWQEIKYRGNRKIDLVHLIDINGNNEAKRLLHELMKDYNRYVLPVQSINQTVNVTLGLKLSQLSDIDERNQIMTTNVWLEHVNDLKKKNFVIVCFALGMDRL